jgi:hypothetical protein
MVSHIDIGDKYLTHSIEYVDDKLKLIKYMYNPTNYITLHFIYHRQLILSSVIFSGDDYEYGFMSNLFQADYFLKTKNRLDIINIQNGQFGYIFDFTFNNCLCKFDYSEFI